MVEVEEAFFVVFENCNYQILAVRIYNVDLNTFVVGCTVLEMAKLVLMVEFVVAVVVVHCCRLNLKIRVGVVFVLRRHTLEL